MTAPERIWADAPCLFDGMDVWHETPRDGATEYVRADTIAALRARLAELEAERDDWIRAHRSCAADGLALTNRAEAAEAALATARADALAGITAVEMAFRGNFTAAEAIMSRLEKKKTALIDKDAAR